MTVFGCQSSENLNYHASVLHDAFCAQIPGSKQGPHRSTAKVPLFALKLNQKDKE
jgi:hypothetical protein